MRIERSIDRQSPELVFPFEFPEDTEEISSEEIGAMFNLPKNAVNGIHVTTLTKPEEPIASKEELLLQTISQNVRQILHRIVSFKQGISLVNYEMIDRSIDSMVPLTDEHYILEMELYKSCRHQDLFEHISEHRDDFFLKKFHPFVRDYNLIKISGQKMSNRQLDGNYTKASNLECFFAEHLHQINQWFKNISKEI